MKSLLESHHVVGFLAWGLAPGGHESWELVSPGSQGVKPPSGKPHICLTAVQGGYRGLWVGLADAMLGPYPQALLHPFQALGTNSGSPRAFGSPTADTMH